MYALASLGAPPLLRGRRGTTCTAKGSDVRPGVPWGSAAFAWQAWDRVHCQGVRCTPWRPLGLRRFCVAGVGQCAVPRGLMYVLASLGAPPLYRRRVVCFGVELGFCSAFFSQFCLSTLLGFCGGGPPEVFFPTLTCGVFVFSSVSAPRPPPPPSRPPSSLTHTLTHSHSLTHTHSLSLTHSHSHTLTHSHSLTHTHTHSHTHTLTHSLTPSLTLTHGSDVRPGVPWGSASFAWQAWDNVHCQGVRCTPWRPLGLRNVHCQGV